MTLSKRSLAMVAAFSGLAGGITGCAKTSSTAKIEVGPTDLSSARDSLTSLAAAPSAAGALDKTDIGLGDKLAAASLNSSPLDSGKK